MVFLFIVMRLLDGPGEGRPKAAARRRLPAAGVMGGAAGSAQRYIIRLQDNILLRCQARVKDFRPGRPGRPRNNAPPRQERGGRRAHAPIAAAGIVFKTPAAAALIS
jgi:hypothetical protein